MNSRNIFLVMVIFTVLISSVCIAEVVNTTQTPSPQKTPVQSVPLGIGTFEFRCNVEGADVILDGQNLGKIKDGSFKTPVQVFDRPVKRQLAIQASGYSTYNETLIQNPKVGETMIVRGTLQTLPMNLTGTLSIAVSPPGGSVSIDDVQSGIVDPSGIMTLRSIKSGNRTVKVSLSGYQDAIQSVYVEANLVTKIRISMVPITTGTLEITSVPAGATVIINGSPYGKTPITVPDLPAGTYTLGFTLPGYLESQNQVALAAGQKVPVSVTLQPVPTPTPTPIPTTQQPTPTPTPTQAGLMPVIAIIGIIGAVMLLRK